MAIDFSALGYDGQQLADDMGLPGDPQSCVWALLRDAARALEAQASPMPRGHASQSAWPDIYRSQSDIFGTERERITDGVQVATDMRYQPDARSIMRAAWMQELMHPRRHRNIGKRPDVAIRAVWLYALRSRPAKVKELTGVGRSSLHRYREKCCANLAGLVYAQVIAA